MNQKLQYTLLQVLVVTLLAGAFFGLGCTFGINRGPHTASAQPQNSPQYNRQLIAAVVREELHRFVNEREESTPARVSSAISRLQTIRSQLELYQVQHNGQYPTLAQLQDNWSVLMNKTDLNGRVSPKADFGPYMQQQPANLFNESTFVVPMNAPTSRAGWAYDERNGSLKLIVSADTAHELTNADAIRIGSADASESALTANLAVLRNAIDLYQNEHNGSWPDATHVVAQLTTYTDPAGNTSATKNSTHIYGPYLRKVPPVPVGAFKGNTGLSATTGPGIGWIYDGAGTIRSNTTNETDTAGAKYSDY